MSASLKSNNIPTATRCMSIIRFSFSVASLSLVAACAELNAIHTNLALPKEGPHIVTIDAKQRAILSSSIKDSKDTDPIVRFCAEPQPDVFTAIASSLGAEASVSQSEKLDITARLASTMSENASTIERTQTVNVLREVMYRNCERYLSGAISKDEFIVQAARDQQLIVQVLAVEQITGVAKAQSTALTTIAKAAAGGVGDEGLKVIADAKSALDKAVAKKSELESAASKLKPEGECPEQALDEAQLPDGVTADEAKKKNAACKDVAEAENNVASATEYYSVVKLAASKVGEVTSESSGELKSAALTVAGASAQIADSVVEITRQYLGFDEVGMTCVVKLRNSPSDASPGYCEDLLNQMVKTRQAYLYKEQQLQAAEGDRILIERVGASNETKNRARKVWDYLTSLGSDKVSSQLTALLSKTNVALAKAERVDFVNAEVFDVFLVKFMALPAADQQKLANSAN